MRKYSKRFFAVFYVFINIGRKRGLHPRPSPSLHLINCLFYFVNFINVPCFLEWSASSSMKTFRDGKT